ncbi:MAG: TIGR00180 family glycosyltransferase [Sneathiellaceae bacterium]
MTGPAAASGPRAPGGNLLSRLRRRLRPGDRDSAPAGAPAPRRGGRGRLYTLVIPTYDRPDLLDRLLSYLAQRGADFPILVLDSSPEPAAARNAARCGTGPLPVTRIAYPAETDPYAKVADGLRAVATPFMSFCADDDLLLLSALDPCLDVLEARREVVGVHGSYLNFSDGPAGFQLEYVVYRGPSVAGADALARLQAQFAAYEAVYYAVMRTEAARRAFMRTADMETTLGKELLSAALTVAQGEVVRLPMLFYARSTGQSYSYSNWHPHQILAREPALLFREYGRFRGILGDGIVGTTGWQGRREDLDTALDMVFLKYMGSFLDSRVLDLIARDRAAGMDGEAVVSDIWTTFVSHASRTSHPETPLFPEGGTGFGPDRYRAGEAIHDYVHDGESIAGPRRTKLLFECVFPTLAPPAVLDAAALRHFIEEVSVY